MQGIRDTDVTEKPFLSIDSHDDAGSAESDLAQHESTGAESHRTSRAPSGETADEREVVVNEIDLAATLEAAPAVPVPIVEDIDAKICSSIPSSRRSQLSSSQVRER